jgi:hypothetical protein
VWATGLGADGADSDTTYASAPHAVNTPLQIYVGGMQATILYQGSAGYPGVTQIDVAIPASVTTGCYVSLAAVTGNVISNVVVLPIQPGGGTCVEPGRGTTITGAQLLQQVQNTLSAVVLNLIQTNATSSKGVVTVTNSANRGHRRSQEHRSRARRQAHRGADACHRGQGIARGAEPRRVPAQLLR